MDWHNRAFAALAFLLLGLPTTSTSAANIGPNTFQAGVNVLLYQYDCDNLEKLNSSLENLFDRLRTDHVNAVSLSFLIHTEGVASSTVFKGEKTPPDEGISLFIRKAKQRGFSVMVRPIIDEQSITAGGKSEWRGTIRPAHVAAWFESYTALLLEYTRVAQAAGADSLVVATELNSMEVYPTKWRAVIEQVRKEFAGALTYSSNQGISATMPWDALDFVGVDAFFKLDTPADATIEEMTDSWRRWVQVVKVPAAKIGKPLVFTEIGVTSQAGAHRESWLWDHKTGVDLEDQRRYYASACAVWRHRLSGMYWWAVTVSMPADPLSNTDFTPLGKPAEAEIASCYK